MQVGQQLWNIVKLEIATPRNEMTRASVVLDAVLTLLLNPVNRFFLKKVTFLIRIQFGLLARSNKFANCDVLI